MSVFIRNKKRSDAKADGSLRHTRPRWASGGRRLALLLFVPTLGPALAARVQAAELSGHVTLLGGGEPQMASLNPYPGSMGACEPAPVRRADDPRDLVLTLAGGPAAVAGAAPAGAPPRLVQVSRSFAPRVLGVRVGTRVDFPNEDSVFHNVFSYSKAKRFDLGYYGKGKSKSVVFDEPGLIKVFCDIHASMSAYILVVDAPFVTQPDAAGEFRFPDLPAGDYQLKLWHPERGELSRAVTVGEAGERLELSF
jgi:plastocyanin